MSYQTSPLPKSIRGFLRRVLPELIYLKYFGRHEKMSLALWQLVAAQAAASSTILDVGAFHGEFAVLARKANKLCEIYAFEPNPESLKTLRPISISSQIVLVENAVSDKNETLYFNCNNQMSKIVEQASANTIKVEAITLDSWSRTNEKHPYLIKIDVEDATAQVLRGSQSIIAESRPVIICEILNDEVGSEIMKILPPDYYFCHINENKGLELKTAIKRYDWRYKNWIFVPNEKKDLLQKRFPEPAAIL